MKFQGNLSIWHVVSLIAVDEKRGNKKSMKEFRDECVRNDWSVDDLRREIQNDKGSKRASGRPPKLRPAATPAIAVQELFIAARHWMAYHKKCLGGPKPVLTHARRADYTPRLRRDATKAIRGLKVVQDKVAIEMRQLQRLLEKIKAAIGE